MAETVTAPPITVSANAQATKNFFIAVLLTLTPRFSIAGIVRGCSAFRV